MVFCTKAQGFRFPNYDLTLPSFASISRVVLGAFTERIRLAVAFCFLASRRERPRSRSARDAWVSVRIASVIVDRTHPFLGNVISANTLADFNFARFVRVNDLLGG